MNALESYTGVSTASAAAVMPTTLLFDTSTPSSVFRSPYTLESISPQQSSILLLYTLSDSSMTTQTTKTVVPTAASFYNSDGGIGVTNLPSSRLATGTAVGTASTLATMASSTASSSTSQATPAGFTPNAATSQSSKTGVAVFALVLTMLLL